tara:strand:+ start:1435 stop:2160 length:726 start_codon:yes stop_codon:yes gene_type:complete
MSAKAIIIQPGAFGDILLCAPIAEIYSNNLYDVYWPTTGKYKNLIDRLEYVNHVLLDNRELNSDWLRSDVIKSCEYIENNPMDVIINLADRGPHNTAQQHGENFEECKYRLANVPIKCKHQLSWRRDTDKENELYELVVGDKEEYIFCHLESSRGDRAMLPSDVKDYIIEGKYIEGFDIYDWYKIIMNAKRIFCVESAFHQFIDGFVTTIPHIEKYILSRSTLGKGETYTYSPYWDKKYIL